MTFTNKKDKPTQHIKQQGHHFANKDPHSQSDGFSNSYIQIWELDHKEGWVLKNWCFQVVALEKTLESLLNSKIKLVHSKGYELWICIGETDAEAEVPILWPTEFNSLHSFEKTLMLGKTEGRKRRGQQRMKWLDGIINSTDMNLSKLQTGKSGVLQSMESQSWTRLSHWTTTERGHSLLACLFLTLTA